MVRHAPAFVRCSATSAPVEVSWYFRYPGFPYQKDVWTETQSSDQSTHDARKQPMIRKKFESCRLDVRFESVQLDAVSIVYKDIFFLGDREKRLVL